MFKTVDSADELAKAFCIRSIVFVHEQKCPYYEEFDGLDFNSCHIIGEAENEPFACARIRYFPEYTKFERIALRKEWRGRGYGKKMIQFMESLVKKSGYKNIKMHSQVYAVPFYEKMGYMAFGETFSEAGISHKTMYKQLDS
ncbi:MAG: GNAT family N-acetyltransferase [Thermodesulfobacteriota bacterium]